LGIWRRLYLLRQYQKAKEQYKEGLNINPKKAHLWSDYANYFMTQYSALETTDKENVLINFDFVLKYMTKSYNRNSKNQKQHLNYHYYIELQGIVIMHRTIIINVNNWYVID